MPTIISLGYREYLLNESVNVNVLIKALEGARVVEKHRPQHLDHYEYTVGEHPEISIDIVRKEQIRPPKKPLGIPAKASPDAHGTNITQRD